MCAIAGCINFSGLDLGRLHQSMQHRGPDDKGLHCEDNITLLHNRLAIVDIKQGKQPMRYQEFTLIFNGEIYNHLELRTQLQEFDFKTFSDTETLLYLLVKYQMRALEFLDGMFAFALYDAKKKELTLARDRAGEKPLYFFYDGNMFLFASELNAIKSVLPLAIDEAMINENLRLGFSDRDKTPYRNVKELKAGTFLQINTKTLVQKETLYWKIEDFYTKPGSILFEEAKQSLDHYLHLSVKRRLESSDLEVGTFLSGGIDSGLVTAIASQYKPNVKTFTVSFEGEYDEAPLAELVAHKYATQHVNLKIDFSSLQTDIESILANYGEPFSDSSAIPSFYVAREAKKYLNVILNGDGADELFGGYRRYVPFSKKDFFSLSPLSRTICSHLKDIAPLPKDKRSMYNYLYRLVDLASKDGVANYLSATTDVFEGYLDAFKHEASLMSLKSHLEDLNKTTLNGLDKLMIMDFSTILPGDLLVKMDIATMINSLEGRSPFLSKEILEFAPSLPSDYKVRGRRTKHILRELAKQYLPEQIIEQPKRGFEIPLRKWVNHDLKELISAYVHKDAYAASFIDRDWIEKLMYNRLPISEEKRSKMIWALFSLEVWYQKVYKGIQCA